MAYWQTSRYQIDLSHPKLMGIVNLTPDSFSDGGQHDGPQAGIAHCERLVKEGVHILDIGGESSRPGAPTLNDEAEWQRIAPVLKAAVTLGVPVSVDTCKTEVMRRSLDLGADIINDIRGLEAPGALGLVARHGQCGVCVMHMRGDPATMQHRPVYPDVLCEVAGYLKARAQALLDLGVAHERITLDPGIGFGKTPEHNLALLKGQRQLLALGWPLLVGWSRKSTLGHLTGRPVEERLAASLAAALASVQRGAHVLRVHDVAATADALTIWAASGLPESGA